MTPISLTLTFMYSIICKFILIYIYKFPFITNLGRHVNTILKLILPFSVLVLKESNGFHNACGL